MYCPEREREEIEFNGFGNTTKYLFFISKDRS